MAKRNLIWILAIRFFPGGKNFLLHTDATYEIIF